MKYIILNLVLTLGLLAQEDVSYKCYDKSSIKKDKKTLAKSGYIENNSKVTLDGLGKVIFFYPCGAPSIIKVKKQTKFNVKHSCKENTLAESLVESFFDKWFAEDEKIIISASSRSLSKIERGNNYFLVGHNTVNSIDLSIYDEDAKFALNINDKDYNIKKYINNESIKIPTNLLTKNENFVRIYEDDIKIFDFSIRYIDIKFLKQKYPESSLSNLERVLMYEKDVKLKFYANKNIDYLLK
ncbi:MAG: hypothetical protein DRG78_24095 [Epsilonproteobacteria bacterium]|nr:MAG: hypothetical protein DRG78_24095 [Campylobacterota bacterium]